MKPSKNPDSPDQSAFVRLFLAHERRIYAYIRSLVPNRADAENVLQETAVVLWQKFAEFDPDTRFISWALTVARFKVLSFHKQRKRDSLTFSDALIDLLEPISAEVSQQSRDLSDALESCLARLATADRELFHRRFLPGITVPKLAEELGRPVTTVYHALDRIRRSLLACIERELRQGER